MDEKDNLRTDIARSDKRKQSFYFPVSMIQEIKDEANRLDRSMSWIVQRAWVVARSEMRKIPSVNETSDGESAADGEHET